MISIQIRSRKLGRTIRFVARDQSGYVYRDPDALSCGKQIFDAQGSACIAHTEDDLRKIARRWISNQIPY
jgi:hypothetical protein